MRTAARTRRSSHAPGRASNNSRHIATESSTQPRLAETRANFMTTPRTSLSRPTAPSPPQPREESSCLFLSLWLVTARSSQLFLRCVAVACEAGDPPGRTQLDQRRWSPYLEIMHSFDSWSGRHVSTHVGAPLTHNPLMFLKAPHHRGSSRDSQGRREC